ncbi:hypothetical protein B0A48_06082 [Cryoendolithus antarcticus]|uniref:Uncharacterized protein n=1 Tax=Cryoendolithus antarcticus TaxID=1507870 RepID=A0A1V8TD69_9PEZI|nr:hypothetical protein B0A48_06082 [Cryoendolithus antarcticus]
MSGRGYAFAGTIIASAFAIMTVYTSLGPELAKQAAERDASPAKDFAGAQESAAAARNGERDTIISRAIASDFKQAAEELKAPGKVGGFAWKLREQIWGTGKGEGSVAAADDGQRAAVAEQELVRDPAK